MGVASDSWATMLPECPVPMLGRDFHSQTGSTSDFLSPEERCYTCRWAQLISSLCPLSRQIELHGPRRYIRQGNRWRKANSSYSPEVRAEDNPVRLARHQAL